MVYSLDPTRSLLRRIRRLPRLEVKALASRSWQIAPSETTIVPPAYFLPGQLERVTDYEFASADYAREMYGGHEVLHDASMGYLIEGATLFNGVLYKKDASTYLKTDHRSFPIVAVREEIARGALYGTWGGIKYFGQWLLDDCTTYPLACEEGLPVTIKCPMSPHALEYERLFGMQPCRVDGAYIRELVLFDDVGQNRDKGRRYAERCAMLKRAFSGDTHEGVFILRGQSGNRRILRNELEVSEHLRKTRGFRIVDPMRSTVPEILSACSGARFVAGIEGSHLVHAIMMLSRGSGILTIMPPFRFCTILKDIADREGLKFGFVVGRQIEDGFSINLDELERTLDLMMSTSPPRY
jgi:hypothetical protein